MTIRTFALCLLVMASARPGSAEPRAEDKRGFHLFHPTPRQLMREMSTDRPDSTETPITVDAGHVQVELSFLEYARDGSRDSYDLLPSNLKIGLTNFADVQFVFQPYFVGDEAEGIGDSQVRLKVNLWGNDGGETALALMPFVSFPTGEDEVGAGKAEWGLIIPFSVGLPNEFGLTVMAEFDVVANSKDDGYRLDFVHTAALGRAIAGPLAGFIEYIGVMPFEAGEDYLAFVAGGLTYAVSPDIQLDVAVQVGLVDEAEDIGLRAGISFRY